MYAVRITMVKKGLGRGLDALLYDNEIQTGSGGVTMLKLLDVEPNKLQARKNFDDAALSELADSILLHGLVQPIVVRKKANGFYEIIAGERRWRASKLAGLSEIPAVIKDVDDRTASEISLIENLQRENLNPVEEANGYRDLIEKFGLTQDEASKRVGKSRVAVTNILRILKLPAQVLKLVEDDELSYGHARALLPLVQATSEAEIFSRAKHIINCRLSVRETENLVRMLLEPKKEPKATSSSEKAYYKQLEGRISNTLGRKALIKQAADGKGQLTLNYSSSQDLEKLLVSLCGNELFENSETDE